MINKATAMLIMLLTAFAMQATAAGTDGRDAAADGKKKKKEKLIELYGNVYDSFTRGKLRAHVTLMRPDSTVIDTTTCHTDEQGTWSWYGFNVPRTAAKFIVKASLDGYHDSYVDYEIKKTGRNYALQIPQHLMRRRSDGGMKSVGLDEVVVRGTRVQIAYRGDTIVYDAAAFNLPEGSMLDGLIRQMPGAEIKDNGDIYVNGKKIDNLLLNGKEFFKGDNRIMLENLPYFTVKNVKVYHKSTERSEFVGHDIEEKEYVMDVKLKREYAKGYIANVEAGAGTEDRWTGRAFGLIYTDHTRASVFANLNNINEDRKPGSDGGWKPSNMPRGLLKTRMAGVNINTEDREKTVKDMFTATLTWKDADNRQSSATETFASAGSIFGGSSSARLGDDFQLRADNQFQLPELGLSINSGIEYNDGRSTSWSRDSTFTTTLINSSYSLGSSLNRNIHIYNNVAWYHDFAWGDFMTLDLHCSYDRSKPAESFDLTRTGYAATGTHDLRNSYTDSHSSGYSYNAEAQYYFILPNKWRINPIFTYSQEQRSLTNGYYRLDRFDNERYEEFGLLPSTRDSLDMVIDAGNSHTETKLTRRLYGAVSFSRFSDNIMAAITFPIDHTAERMNYHHAALDTTARRSLTAFQPNIWFNVWGKTSFEFRYRYNVTQPEFASLMPVVNDSDPLSIRINNPELRNSKTHKVNGRITFSNDSIGSSVYISFDFTSTRDARGTRTTYNPATGAYTRTADNVDGNWSGSLGAGWQRPIDSKKRLRLDISGSVKYEHSVDFDIAYDTDAGALSRVDNVYTRLNGKLSYRLGKLSIAAVSRLAMRNSTGDREDFDRIDTYDYQYGGNAQYTIPLLNITLATDINMYSRRGYSSPSMNTDDLVWNAQLSRSFLKGRLTAKLQAFDMLHRLTNVRYAINAQGRTETRYNCIPRYVMLTAAYKL